MIKFVFNILFLFLIISCSKDNASDKEAFSISKSNDSQLVKPILDKVKTSKKGKEALEFSKVKNFNTDFCILIDMSLHSGINRLLIFDFKNNEIKESYLVGHGCGNAAWSADETKDNPTFSNVEDSHLSSLGKYKIGERGYSNWGVNVKYLMHGLEETNNNAVKRVIVFHSWEKMSDDEVYPTGSPEGWGCPTVSNNAFREIDALLKTSAKPVLMWIYDS